jgi:hypothetical protein
MYCKRGKVRTQCSSSPDADACALCYAFQHNRKQLEELRATLSHQLITPTLFGTRAITATSLAHLVPLLVQVTIKLYKLHET